MLVRTRDVRTRDVRTRDVRTRDVGTRDEPRLPWGIYMERPLHVHVGRLPETEVARLLQSALVQWAALTLLFRFGRTSPLLAPHQQNGHQALLFKKFCDAAPIAN